MKTYAQNQAKRMANIASDLTDGAIATQHQTEKFNMHLKYLAGVGVLIFDRWRYVSFCVNRQSMQYYQERFDILEEVVHEIIPEIPDREVEFMGRLHKLKSLMANMVIKDGDGNPSQFRTNIMEECKSEMDNFRLEILKLINKMGWLKFRASNPNFAIQELE